MSHAARDYLCVLRADGTFLARRYFLFAAALIVLSNEYASLYYNSAAEARISQAISLMAYCARTDPQGKRLVWILGAFQEVVAKQSSRGTKTYQYSRPSTTAHTAIETILGFFANRPGDFLIFKPAGPGAPISRHGSLATFAVPPSPVPGITPIKLAKGITSPEMARVAASKTMDVAALLAAPPSMQFGLDSGMVDRDGLDEEGFTVDTMWNWSPAGRDNRTMSPPDPGPPGPPEPPRPSSASRPSGQRTTASVPSSPGSSGPGPMHTHEPPPPGPRMGAFPPFTMALDPSTPGHSTTGSSGASAAGINLNVPLYPSSDF